MEGSLGSRDPALGNIETLIYYNKPVYLPDLVEHNDENLGLPKQEVLMPLLPEPSERMFWKTRRVGPITWQLWAPGSYSGPYSVRNHAGVWGASSAPTRFFANRIRGFSGSE